MLVYFIYYNGNCKFFIACSISFFNGNIFKFD